jgi:hypothetical protein
MLRFDVEYIGADPLDLTEDRGAIFIFHTPTLEQTAQITGMTSLMPAVRFGKCLPSGLRKS